MELISREDVLKCIDEMIVVKGGEENSKDILARVFQGIKDGLIEKIEGIPSQWVEINEAPFGKVYQNAFVTFMSTETYDEVKRKLRRPTGMWKHLGETIRAVTLEMHQCSECGYVVLTRTEFNQESYCPHCGADMREGE